MALNNNNNAAGILLFMICIENMEKYVGNLTEIFLYFLRQQVSLIGWMDQWMDRYIDRYDRYQRFMTTK